VMVIKWQTFTEKGCLNAVQERMPGVGPELITGNNKGVGG